MYECIWNQSILHYFGDLWLQQYNSCAEILQAKQGDSKCISNTRKLHLVVVLNRTKDHYTTIKQYFIV